MWALMQNFVPNKNDIKVIWTLLLYYGQFCVYDGVNGLSDLQKQRSNVKDKHSS